MQRLHNLTKVSIWSFWCELLFSSLPETIWWNFHSSWTFRSINEFEWKSMRLAVPPTNPSSEVKSMHAKYWGNSIESIPLVANFPSLTFKLMHFLVIIGQGRVGHRMKNFAIHYFTLIKRSFGNVMYNQKWSSWTHFNCGVFVCILFK